MKQSEQKNMKNKQHGSFVLEALIAILLFAIGILAIVGLQATSIGNTAAAKYRTDASLLANQIIAQMWVADKTNATLIANFCGPVVSGVCAAAGPNYLAWASSVAQVLPGVSNVAPAPSIAIDANNTATVTVFWQGPNESAAHNYSTVATIND
jgi:type IV pilus assembly protein PilV